jgi:hypothetical protein
MAEETNPHKNSSEKNKEIQNSNYKLSLEDNEEESYNLQIGIKSEFLFFKLFKSNSLTFEYYTNKYDLKEIINILYLSPSLYDSLEKVKKIIDDLFSKKKYTLKMEKDHIILIFKIPIYFRRSRN